MPCGEAGFLCCVPTSVELECEAVPLRRAPPRGRGASLAAAPVFQSSGLPPNWPARDRSCFRMQNAMPARGPPPLRPPISSRSCPIRTTSSPVSSPRLIGVGDRAGRGVAKECYLVDPAMLLLATTEDLVVFQLLLIAFTMLDGQKIYGQSLIIFTISTPRLRYLQLELALEPTFW